MSVLFESLHKYRDNVKTKKRDYMIIGYMMDGYSCKTKTIEELQFNDTDKNYRISNGSLVFDIGMYTNEEFINGELIIPDKLTLTDIIYKLINCNVFVDNTESSKLRYVFCDEKYPVLYGYLENGSYILLYDGNSNSDHEIFVNSSDIPAEVLNSGTVCCDNKLLLHLNHLPLTCLNNFLVSAFYDANAISDLYCWAYMPYIMLKGLMFAKTLCEEEFNLIKNPTVIKDDYYIPIAKSGKVIDVEYNMQHPNLLDDLDTIENIDDVDSKLFYNSLFMKGMRYIKYTDNGFDYQEYMRVENELMCEFSKRCLLFFKCRCIVTNIVYNQYVNLTSLNDSNEYVSKNSKIKLKIKEC